MSKPGVAARLGAARIIGRVLRQGAYSNVLTNSGLGDLSDEDRRFATSLVYGVLRNRAAVDHSIAGRTADRRVESEVRDILRVAAFELGEGRTPTHAVVDSAVEAARMAGKERAAGFVNGVLRALARHPQAAWLDGDAPRDLRWSVPAWLLTSLDAQWGSEETDRFLAASHESPAIGMRLRKPVELGPSILERDVLGFSEAVYGTELIEGAVVQDPASIAVGRAAAVQPTDVVLDMAAAPGGKAIHLADIGPRLVIAADRHERRVATAAKRSRQAGHSFPWLVADGRRPPFRGGTFDVVVVDAPCSGLGTLRRRPEIKDRVQPEGVERLAAIQREMLAAALSLVRPGGRIVYSVCTVTREETTDQVSALNAAAPDGIPGKVWGNGVLLAPHITGTDGMFISIVRRA